MYLIRSCNSRRDSLFSNPHHTHTHTQLRRYLLTEGSRITPATILLYIHQLSMAMVHLESLNFVHRDIAARNVLMATHDVIKLGDFGLSRGLDDADYYVGELWSSGFHLVGGGGRFVIAHFC